MTQTPAVTHADVWRAQDPAEATALIGVNAAPLLATVTTATIARDLETGAPVYAYLPIGDVDGLRAALDDVARAEAHSVTPNRTAPPLRFGWARDGNALTKQHLTSQPALDEWAGRLHGVLAEHLPDVAARDEANLADVRPARRIVGTTFTSGEVHRTTPAPYKRDLDAFPTWQAMTAVRAGVTGGYLHLPEYGAVLALSDGWAAFFNGRSLVHGVTAIDRTHPYGHLNAVTYYALAGTDLP